MNILICYASTEGMTRKIARFCAGQLIARGHSVEVLAATDAEEVTLEIFDAAILAGSVHLGKVQTELARFASAHAMDLNRRPTLFLQVSLAALSTDETELADLHAIASRFSSETGWKPGAVHHVAGAFRFTQYDFFKGWAMRWIASQKDLDLDPHTDTELTDWDALAAVLKDWPPAT